MKQTSDCSRNSRENTFIFERGLELELMVVTRIHSKSSSTVKSLSKNPPVASIIDGTTVTVKDADIGASVNYVDSAPVFQGFPSSAVVEGHSAVALKNRQHVTVAASSMSHCPKATNSTSEISDFGTNILRSSPSAAAKSMTSLNSLSYNSSLLGRNDHYCGGIFSENKSHNQNTSVHNHSLRHSKSAAYQFAILNKRYNVKAKMIATPTVISCEHIEHFVTPITRTHSALQISRQSSSTSSLEEDGLNAEESEALIAETHNQLSKWIPQGKIKPNFNEMSYSFTTGSNSDISEQRNSSYHLASTEQTGHLLPQHHLNPSVSSSFYKTERIMRSDYGNEKLEHCSDQDRSYGKNFKRRVTRQASFMAAVLGNNSRQNREKESISMYDLSSNDNSLKKSSIRQSLGDTIHLTPYDVSSGKSSKSSTTAQDCTRVLDYSEIKNYSQISGYSTGHFVSRSDLLNNIRNDDFFDQEGRNLEKLNISKISSSNDETMWRKDQINENSSSLQPTTVTSRTRIDRPFSNGNSLKIYPTDKTDEESGSSSNTRFIVDVPTGKRNSSNLLHGSYFAEDI
uniref:DUF4005 domain-containing protein n=1 Tax=Setaria digitata TaxID=48799 RepID=A0A915Q0L3_9BILA